VTSSRPARNVICHLLDGVFFFAALIVVSYEMVIPRMITDLSSSALLLGLVPLIRQAGVLLPQVFVARRVEGLAYKKPAVLLFALLQRVGCVVMFVSLYVRWSPVFTLTVFFATLTAYSLATGMTIPVWVDWYGKTVPEAMWGRVLGMRRALPAVLGVALGKAIQFVMRSYAAPQRYKLLMGAGLLFYALSFACLLLVKEERDETLSGRRVAGWRDYLRGLKGILTAHREFRVFMVGNLLTLVPIVVMSAFLTRYGLGWAGAPDGVTGTWTAFYFGAMAVGSLLGGVLGDSENPIAPFRVFPAAVALAGALACCSAHPAVVSAAWALVGLAFGGQIVGMMPAVFRYSGRHRRPTYMAVRFVVLGTACAALPPLVGLAVDAGLVGYGQVFFIAGASALTGWVLFLRMPRPGPQAVTATARTPGSERTDGGKPAAPGRDG